MRRITRSLAAVALNTLLILAMSTKTVSKVVDMISDPPGKMNERIKWQSGEREVMTRLHYLLYDCLAAIIVTLILSINLSVPD